MSFTKIVFFGPTKSGKTKLVNALLGTKYEGTYKHTIGLDTNITEISDQDDKLMYVETGKVELFDERVSKLFQDAKLGVYCIELSEGHLNLDNVKEDIERFKENWPGVDIVLAVTKIDANQYYLGKENPLILHQKKQLTEIESVVNPSETFVTSAFDGREIDSLKEHIKQKALKLAHPEALAPVYELNLLKPFWDELMVTLEDQDLSAKKAQEIRELTLDLYDILTSGSNIEDNTKAINEYAIKCNEILENPSVTKAIWLALNAVVLTLFFTAVAFGLGFAAGFVIGSLLGPAGLVTGFAVGGAAAAVSITVVLGLGMYSLYAHPEAKARTKRAVDAFVEEALVEEAKKVYSTAPDEGEKEPDEGEKEEVDRSGFEYCGGR